MNHPVLECVPNFSEGRNAVTINAIAEEIRKLKGVRLLHIDASPAANRTVMTFAGNPKAVTEAAFNCIQKASELIDMRVQEGVHPRIGATDVCPLIPLANMSMEEAVLYSKMLASRVGESLGIPVYLYEHSQEKSYRKALPQIRKGNYEGLKIKIQNEKWRPDFGQAAFNEKSGATVMGVRDILVAFNVSLKTKEVGIARQIAKRIRESGYWDATAQQQKKGLLANLRAIGWFMEDYGNAQVSFNLLNHKKTRLIDVFETCKVLAEEFNIAVVGSEVIGLVPEICLLEAGLQGASKNKQDINDKDELIKSAIDYMGLNKLKPFRPQEKILEYTLQQAGLIS